MRFDEMPQEQQRALSRKGGLTPNPRNQLLRTECRRGHQLTDDNVQWVNCKRRRVDGQKYIYRYRVCRMCQTINRQRFQERHAERKVSPPPQLYCKRGHKLAVTGVSQPVKGKHVTAAGVETSYTYSRCLACRRENHIAREAKKGRVVTRGLKKYEA